MRRKLLAIFSLALLALAVSFPASAQQVSARPIKDRLCVARCRHEVRVCLAAARVELRLCAETNCAEAIAAAREACEADAASEECAEAREAVRECLEPCREKFREAAGTCRTELKSCLESCPDQEPPPPPKDPECLAGCREDLALCLDLSRTAAKECREACVPLVEEARAACADDRTSEACQEARRALYECMRPCKEQLRQDTHACVVTVRECVRSCPNATDPNGNPGGVRQQGVGSRG